MLCYAMPIPRHEQETTTTHIRGEVDAYLSTMNSAIAAKWQRLDYPVKVAGTQDGVPTWWKCCVPAACLSYRRVAQPRKTPLTEAQKDVLRLRLSSANRRKTT